jgi:CRISPR-associated protein Cmr2
MTKKMHFTIGPVQEFVAQSRRTRDLLASSFLLSYLAAHAMSDVLEYGGEIIFPNVHDASKVVVDPLLRAVHHKKTHGPWIGSIPNRFCAELGSDYHPYQTVEAVKKAWLRIANTVWNKVIEPVASLGNSTREIWDRQVENFWEIAWVIGEDAELLNRRKLWRSFIPTKEAGDKCMLLPHLQELSGYSRSRNNKKQGHFWDNLRKYHGDRLGVKENERLSALGMIKRFYPLYAKEALGWKFPHEATSFPSTGYLASLAWRRKTSADKYLSEANDYALLAMKNGYELKHTGKRFFPEQDGLFISIEEDALYKQSITSIPELNKKFAALCKAVGESPRFYYAILVMDGDRIGDLLRKKSREKHGEKQVSQALVGFSGKVESIVNDHSGALVYAGGDDVLALFPSDTVLGAAIQLRRHYQDMFKEMPESTISAGVVYVHQMAPLKNALHQAHSLLNKVAKEKYERDSIAIGVWNQSGELSQWGAKWKEAISKQTPNKLKCEELAEFLKLSQSFLYQLKNVYEPFAASLNQNDFTQMVIAEWERISGSADEQVRTVLATCIDLDYREDGSYSADGATLISWLRQKE